MVFFNNFLGFVCVFGILKMTKGLVRKRGANRNGFEKKKAKEEAEKRANRKLKMMARNILKHLKEKILKTNDGEVNSFLSMPMDIKTIMSLLQLIFDIDGVLKRVNSTKLLYKGKPYPSVIFTLTRAQIAHDFMKTKTMSLEKAFQEVVDKLSIHEVLIEKYEKVVENIIELDNHYYQNVGYTLGGGYDDGKFDHQFVKLYFMFSLLEEEEQIVSDTTAKQAIFLMKLLKFLKINGIQSTVLSNGTTAKYAYSLEGREYPGLFTQVFDIVKQNPSVMAGEFKKGSNFYAKPQGTAFLNACLPSVDSDKAVMFEDSYPNASGASKAGLNVFLTKPQKDDGMSPDVLLFVFCVALFHGYQPEKSDIEFLSLLGFNDLF